jgi:hypothetical protein
MSDIINKELIGELLKLENDQQEKVLTFIKQLLQAEEMNKNAAESIKAIEEQRMKSFEQFDQSFEQWKKRKRLSMK